MVFYKIILTITFRLGLIKIYQKNKYNSRGKFALVNMKNSINKKQRINEIRAKISQQATWISVLLNTLLTIIQIIIGWVANSSSLLFHGVHSFSDLLSDFLVIFAAKQSANPADENHPYGHARMETAATLILGISLTIIGGGIIWETLYSLNTYFFSSSNDNSNILKPVEIFALVAAIITVIGKESLYHYLKKVAQKLRSSLIMANALHTRADSASALIVVIGIAGALAGWTFLDLIAAVIMGIMIFKMGISLSLESLKELIDTGLDNSQIEIIKNILLNTDGVISIHDLRTRKMAQNALVDVHLQVNSKITVTEAHRIAETAKYNVLKQCKNVLDVLVHIDPDDDININNPDEIYLILPSRKDIIKILQPAISNVDDDNLILHYINGKVSVDILVKNIENKIDSNIIGNIKHQHSYIQNIKFITVIEAI